MSLASVSPKQPLTSDQFTILLPKMAHPQLHTISLHDALPISICKKMVMLHHYLPLTMIYSVHQKMGSHFCLRSEEHTSELQSRGHIVCRLLLEKKHLPSTHSHLSTNDSLSKSVPICAHVSLT